MENKSEWRLLAASVLLDAALGLAFGFQSPIIHALLVASAIWLTFCALAGHSSRWFCTFAEEWRKVLISISQVLPLQRRVFNSIIRGLLQYVFSLHEFFASLAHPGQIPDRPCPCGAVLPDGSRPAFKDHCWRKP
jgi:hypothetical protein